jgi:hypothetical protein
MAWAWLFEEEIIMLQLSAVCFKAPSESYAPPLMTLNRSLASTYETQARDKENYAQTHWKEFPTQSDAIEVSHPKTSPGSAQ